MLDLAALKRSTWDRVLGREGGAPSSPSRASGRGGDRMERRQSKRELVRDLIRRAREARSTGTAPPREEGARQGGAGKPSTTQASSSPQASDSTSGEEAGVPSPPSSAANPNKPLHSPPPQGAADKADGQPTRPLLKLHRIMATLSEDEVEKLFSGAPQYFARSMGHGSGAPHPSVAFPWDEELSIRDLTDHMQIEDPAWGSVTAIPHVIHRDPLSAPTPSGKARPHFTPICQERPNMLSMQGLEKGTIGYEAALELSVADALLEEQYGFDSLGSKSRVVVEQRQKLITSKDGLRHLDDAAIIEQLLKCEERYQGEPIGKALPHDLYNELFVKVLHPPLKVIDHNDPYSLAVQIHALVRVLATPNAWVDFSHVEWRIRLGEVLWGVTLDDELEDGTSITEGHDDEERSEERYWMLLQILLACELLIRLDTVTHGFEMGGDNLKASEVHKFEKEAQSSVRWSLILARTWLENIAITKSEASHSGTSTPKGWITTLTSRMTLKHEHMYGAYFVDHTQHRRQTHPEYIYAIKGKYFERQLGGLEHFARKLRWPDVEDYVTRLSINAPSMAKATPINSPPLPTGESQRSSYFGSRKSSAEIQRAPVRRRKIGAALHSAGWLSKSYLSGLYLPGEALSHCLMSTLLENDAEAMSRLGSMANLCGGFVYNGKSFWSTACVVGRVLAAGRGSAECMGWISSDLTPNGLGDGWLDVKVEDIPADVAQTGKKARLWGKIFIERESDCLGDADPSNVLPADFIIPYVESYPQPPPSNIVIDLKTFDLSTIESENHPTPTVETNHTPSTENSLTQPLQTRSATMSFRLTHDGFEQGEEFKFSLDKDVYFVTAHPCVPSSRTKFFRSPTSPTIQRIDIGGISNDAASSPAHVTGHPLHKFYTYRAVHLTEILRNKEATLEEFLRGRRRSSASSIASSNGNNLSGRSRPRVLVIDCTTGFAPPRTPDMQTLSRMSSISSSSFGAEPTVPQIQPPTPPKDRGCPSTPPRSNGIRVNGNTNPITAAGKMKLGTRKRQFGSDLEILVRALCAERGWNALISRRRRGCLACAIREAGALGWKVIIRVD